MVKHSLNTTYVPDSEKIKKIKPEDMAAFPTIGDKLKEAHSRHPELSQKDIAKITGLTAPEINRLEKNITLRPSKEKIKKLTPFIGESYDVLLMYAGYTNLEDNLFIDNDGNRIDHMKVVENIYRADWELLKLLSELSGENSLSDNELQMIKKYLLISRHFHSACKAAEKPDSLFNMFTNFVTYIMVTLNSFISILGLV